ncbi:MAG: FAD-dependent oxidoreductase [Eubacteriales bacterium]|nr:FAD-dependent oxidoreductase [Eubacteriales bacterium]
MRKIDLVIIGGGAAGMSAAVAAKEEGCNNLLIIERNDSLGGVLHQCIHNGFGLHRFGEDLTGVEFAWRYEELVEGYQIPYMLNTFVIDISPDKIVTCVSPVEGLIKIQAQAIILAMGCRERSRNALLIPGTRGAGIMTAGTAQKYLNLMGYLPGKNVVILGSGDIGLIMARQFVMEGVKVSAVVEVMPYSGGLPRNMKQCIEDFDIPVYYSSTVSKICGRERVSSVWVSKVNENREPIEGTEFEIPCDTLMISAGLIPENELTDGAGIAMSPMTKGAVVYENNETSIEGIFSCGNVLHVHDLVDFVSEEGAQTGKYAYEYINSVNTTTEYIEEDDIKVEKGPGASAIVPQRIHRNTSMDNITFMFRPSFKKNDVTLCLSSGEKILVQKKMIAVTPGEMCKLVLPKEKLAEVKESVSISIHVNEKEA